MAVAARLMCCVLSTMDRQVVARRSSQVVYTQWPIFGWPPMPQCEDVSLFIAGTFVWSTCPLTCSLIWFAWAAPGSVGELRQCRLRSDARRLRGLHLHSEPHLLPEASHFFFIAPAPDLRFILRPALCAVLSVCRRCAVATTQCRGTALRSRTPPLWSPVRVSLLGPVTAR